jgi:hypothetical protein
VLLKAHSAAIYVAVVRQPNVIKLSSNRKEIRERRGKKGKEGEKLFIHNKQERSFFPSILLVRVFISTEEINRASLTTTSKGGKHLRCLMEN